MQNFDIYDFFFFVGNCLLSNNFFLLCVKLKIPQNPLQTLKANKTNNKKFLKAKIKQQQK